MIAQVSHIDFPFLTYINFGHNNIETIEPLLLMKLPQLEALLISRFALI